MYGNPLAFVCFSLLNKKLRTFQHLEILKLVIHKLIFQNSKCLLQVNYFMKKLEGKLNAKTT